MNTKETLHVGSLGHRAKKNLRGATCKRNGTILGGSGDMHPSKMFVIWVSEMRFPAF